MKKSKNRVHGEFESRKGVCMNDKRKMVRILIYSFKIALGSCIAIYIAELFHLENAASAGSITLLTLVTTKWETLKLSLFRILTFFTSVLLAAILFTSIPFAWVDYGLYILGIAIFCEWIGWRTTISVNAVIGIHFLNTRDFSAAFVSNEFLLVLIGIAVAIVINLFHNNGSRRRDIIENMRYTENRMQLALGELAAYLSNHPMERNVWDDIISLEKNLHRFLDDAYQYQNNTFQSHPVYYIDYFEMRLSQCQVLHNLHYEVKKIREIPSQAHVVAEYILYMAEFVKEMNKPQNQLDELEKIFQSMREQPLPVTREEFESRAILYHILMDLEDFLVFKRRFIESRDEQQIRIYWMDNADAGR